MRHARFSIVLYLAATLTPGPVLAAACGSEPGGFAAWLDGFRQEADAAGLSQQTIAAALGDVAYESGIVAKDRAQGVFRQSFEQFSSRMVSPYRLQKGASLLQRYRATFTRIEQQYGVPGAVLVAIWGLETDFGANAGKLPTLPSLATLAYDCRRADMFRAELLDALRVIERGDLQPGEMRGAWAGEIGQTQFMPSSYMKFAVDFDGDGRRDLIRSAPDALASTANYLKSYGWQRGASWDPGAANFDVILQWNKSQVYARTIAFYADKLAQGALARGEP
jgi:lytic murein transglycosylase